MQSILAGENVQLKTFFMDTKNAPGEKSVHQKVEEALGQIRKFNPDVIIASDDAAVKYIIVPWFKGKQIPVVFCGVNWSAKQYGLPVENITGMLEVLPLKQNLQIILNYYPGIKNLVVLSEQSLSEEKNKEILDTLYKKIGFSVTYYFVENFSDWKEKFIEANGNSDIIYLPTNGAIKNWNDREAIDFVTNQIKKPVITCDDFMMPYCVYGLTKVAEEQGQWAAKTAMRILEGTSPSRIPVVANKESQSYLNEKLALKIGFEPSTELLSKSKILH